MNTFLAAPAARRISAVDVLFTKQSKSSLIEALRTDSHKDEEEDGKEKAGGSNSGTGGLRKSPLNAEKLCIDIYKTNGKVLPTSPRNVSAFEVNLLDRVNHSIEGLWRNPVTARIATWGRREVMHVFNGVFHQSITDYETYETFGKCYTCPDPFRNDDPPWEPCFCI